MGAAFVVNKSIRCSNFAAMTSQTQPSEKTHKLCLVTGATGLVGSHVALHLLQHGYAVRATYRSQASIQTVCEVFGFYNQSLLFDQIEWLRCDVLSETDVSAAVAGVDAVFHTASLVSFQSADSQLLWRTNVDGTAIVCEAARLAQAVFCHVSSIATIGSAIDGFCRSELTQWQPEAHHSVYSLSKFWQEAEVWKSMEEGLLAVIVAPGVVLGPCAKGHSSSAIATTMQRPMPFFTSGATGYVDARDLAEVMIQLVERQLWGQKYVVVAHNSTVRNVQTLFAQCFGRTAPKIKAGKLLLHLAACFCPLAAFFSRKPQSLTHQSVRTICGDDNAPCFSSQKLLEATQFCFRPLGESVKNMAQFFCPKNDTTKQL